MILKNTQTIMQSSADPESFLQDSKVSQEQSERENSQTNVSSSFIVKDRNFMRQYAHIYCERLNMMRKRVTDAAVAKFGNQVPVKQLHELSVGCEVIVVGTLFKLMELKPNILKELSEEHGLQPQEKRSHYTSEADSLVLEDDLQRVTLCGGINVQDMVSGVIVAVRGHETDSGKFEVTDHCFGGIPNKIPFPVIPEDRHIVLVSGLELGDDSEGSTLLPVQLLTDWVCGELGSDGQQLTARRVVRFVMAGNSLGKATQDKEATTMAKYLSKKSSAASVKAMKCLDDILSGVASGVPVDVMPGEFDPANYFLPQQPLHRVMFTKAANYSTMTCVTNPYMADVDGVRVVGTSGQPVDDICRYSSLSSRLHVLERCLQWGHLAPTAPDTLSCYPYFNEDPFIIGQCPHVFFAGNQPEFGCRHVDVSGQRVLLVSVPRFSETHTACLINLRTLECSSLSFGAAGFSLGDSSAGEK